MAKYVLLECNRLRGTNIINEEDDKYKNKWTNLVSSTGIVINKGDNIAVEQVIVNSRGASDTVMEFQGIKNEQGFLDNKARLEYSFYINHNGTQTARMPFINTRVFRGNTDVLGINIVNNPPASGGTPKSNNGSLPPFGDLTRLLSCRSLGENLFFGDGGAGGLNIYDATKASICVNLYYLGSNMLFRAKTTQTGASSTGNVNGGYIAGNVYTTSGGTGSGMKIKIEQTTTSGNIYGIVQNWSVEDMGTGYTIGDNITIVNITTPAGTDHIIQVESFPDIATFTSSNNKSFDGSRFFFANPDYTGLLDKNEAISNGVPITASNDIDKLNNGVSKRTLSVDLEVDSGFLTPDNVGQILTDQFHKPNKISSGNNSAPFLDYNNTRYFIENTTTGQSEDGKGVIVDTPTFTPMMCNFEGSGVPNVSVDNVKQVKDTLSNCRKQFYNNIAWKDADRYFALKNCFYNFGFSITDENPATDIRTGNNGTEYTITTIGDFACLNNVKNMGVRVCLLNNFTATTGSSGKLVGYNKNAVIATNMKFTQSNVDRLANHFHKAEKYTGDLSKNIDTSSDYYKSKLAVNLDIGMYDDENSTQGKLTQDNLTSQPAVNQRFRYCAYTDTAPLCGIPVDYDNDNACVGFQRDFNNLENDGQQLSSIWVRSRWRDGFNFDNKDNYPVDDRLNTDLDTGGFILQNDGVDGFDTTFGGIVSNVRTFYTGRYEDPSGDVLTHQDYLQMAKDADLAIIPLFPRNTGTDKFGEVSDYDETQAYIGFISRYEIGLPTHNFDVVNLDNPNNVWKIDLFNANMGIQLGLDPSFTRNEAVCVVSPQLGNNTPNFKENYVNMINIGAVNPTINFNPNLSRFEIGGLNTPTTIGNGLHSSIPETVQANPNPDQQIINVNRREQVMRMANKTEIEPNTPLPNAVEDVVDMFNGAIQENGTVLDSQSGIAIENLYLFDESGNTTEITDANAYRDSLLDKMGFDIKQILGDYGSENAVFVNQFTFQSIPQTYKVGNEFFIKPITTGSYVSSSEIQTLSTNQEGMPMYDLGMDTSVRPVEPSITNGVISAFKLPVKLSFPYLCVYSSIPSGGTDTQYIGGSDGESKISCMGFLTRENNEGDFFYQGGTSFNFTAMKDFTLSEVETDIRLPDGSRPKLDPHSAVIYKITKPLGLVPTPNPTPQERKK